MNPEELITAKEREKIQIFIEGKDYDVQHKFESYLVVKQSVRNSSLDKEILRTKSYKEDSSPKYQEDFIIHYYFESNCPDSQKPNTSHSFSMSIIVSSEKLKECCCMMCSKIKLMSLCFSTKIKSKLGSYFFIQTSSP